MDSNTMNAGLPNKQALESAQKNQNMEEMEKLEEKENRFKRLGAGSLIYALFYTFCLYKNSSGITYPFFVGATLLYFGYYTKKCTESCAREHSLWGKASCYRRFLVAAVLILGALNCMTGSEELIFFNKTLMYVMLGVLILQTWHNISDWSIAAHLKGIIFLVIGALSQILEPLYDRGAAKKLESMKGEKEREKCNLDSRRILGCILIGFIISVPLICILLLLLSSADVVFYNLLCSIFSFELDADFVDFIWDLLSVAFCIIIVFGLSYGALCYCNDKDSVKNVDDMAVRNEKKLDVYVAMTINVLVCAIYLVFSGIQILGLFMGRLTLPEGYTYAGYARTGFFQLVFVCLINIILVLCMLAYFETCRALKAVLCIICGCTYIMEASSLFRLLMYIKSYNLTFTRVLALWGLAVIAVVMAGVICCIFMPRFKLFRYVLVTIAVGWIAFSAVHPDYWIARYNIAKAEMGEAIDEYYLKHSLSLDAMPALEEADYCFDSGYAGFRSSEIEEYREQTKGLLGFRRFNFSKAYASLRYMDNKKVVNNP